MIKDLPDVSEAKPRGRLFRVSQIALGVILVLAGIAMSFLPGPGVVTILAGLTLIKPDNWLYRWLRKRTPGIPDDGPIPRRTLAIGITFAVVLVAISATISILYGSRITGWIADTLGISLSLPF